MVRVRVKVRVSCGLWLGLVLVVGFSCIFCLSVLVNGPDVVVRRGYSVDETREDRVTTNTRSHIYCLLLTHSLAHAPTHLLFLTHPLANSRTHSRTHALTYLL